MSAESETRPGNPFEGRPVFEVLEPAAQTAPVVFASGHSGDVYPPDFVAQSRLDPLTLRNSEDSFVDEIFEAAPACGAPLLRALFPRAYLDPNREAFELDPDMFDGLLPDYVNTGSPRVAAGLGTVARVVTNGEEIYKVKLAFADAQRRIETCYRPYHAALARLIDQTRARFGHCVLIDCHSMPSVGGPMDRDPGSGRVDFVLGDCYGTSCDAELTELVEASLRDRGYRVRRNMPYSGGFVTQHYGRPEDGIHALQIEINRALYMDEHRIERLPDLERLKAEMAGLVAALTRDDALALAS